MTDVTADLLRRVEERQRSQTQPALVPDVDDILFAVGEVLRAERQRTDAQIADLRARLDALERGAK